MKNHISRIQIMGDIHSGTRWLYSLVGQNVDQDVESYGGHCSEHKHDHFSSCSPRNDTLYIYSLRIYESWLPRVKVLNYGHYQNLDDAEIYNKYCSRILSNLAILQELNCIYGRLDVFQKNQGRELIKEIFNTFNIPTIPNFQPITKHTKSHAQWWHDANKSLQPNYNFDYCNNNKFKSLMNQLQSELFIINQVS